MEVYGGGRYSSTHSQPRHQMEASGKPHVLAALTPMSKPTGSPHFRFGCLVKVKNLLPLLRSEPRIFKSILQSVQPNLHSTTLPFHCFLYIIHYGTMTEYETSQSGVKIPFLKCKMAARPSLTHIFVVLAEIIFPFHFKLQTQAPSSTKNLILIWWS